MSDETLDTRRAVVRGAAAGGLLLLLGGAAAAPAQLRGDRPIVAAALAAEEALLRVYEGAGGGGAAEGGIARRFAEQQREHVAALSQILGQRPDAPGDGGGGDFLREAIRLEEDAIAAYYEAHQRLSDSALIKLGAGIMANHGQHLVVLREALGQDPVPEAFATGG